ncbi:MAG: GC-type dockerin domain-anchored protein [Phycisphaerales bacterium]
MRSIRVGKVPFWTLAAAVAGMLTPTTAGQPCEPEFAAGLFGAPGTNNRVTSSFVWDDGSGEALYIGGAFSVVGSLPASGIARWDGAQWSTLGEGVSDGPVSEFTSFDDGSGEMLYVGGAFTTIGGVSASHVARWDGAAWMPLGSGMNGPVYALEAFDDGTGLQLFAAGWFSEADGQAASAIAKWDGTSWQDVGGGVTGSGDLWIFDLAVFDDGTGPALYAAGEFETAGGVPARGSAKWDGTEWSPLGSGFAGLAPVVYTLEVFNDGSGEALYAGGSFDFVGGVTAANIARWDGSDWSAVGAGLDDDVVDLEVDRFLVVPALFAAGRFVKTEDGSETLNYVGAWTGRDWEPLRQGTEPGLSDRAFTLKVFEDEQGRGMYVGGSFSADVAGQTLSFIGRWDDSGWTPLGGGLDAVVEALVSVDLGSGEALYAGGQFQTAGSTDALSVAKWDGAQWSPLGLGLDGTVADMTTVVVDGRTQILVGGNFTQAGAATVNRIALWDGNTWNPLGDGFNSWVTAVAVFDDGSGPAIYAGGGFSSTGSTRLDGIAKWDGTAWVRVGSDFSGTVRDLVVYDDGTGPALYASGRIFSADGMPALGIARWDGVQWSPVGGGLTGTEASGNAMAVFPTPSGPQLVVAGNFTAAGGITMDRIASWDGTEWRSLGSGISRTAFSGERVDALGLFEVAGQVLLFAGGDFGIAGDVESRNVAWWDGSEWFGFDEGMRNGPISAIAQFDTDGESALYLGGYFSHAERVPSPFIAKMTCATVACRVDFNGDGSLDIFDFLAFQTAFDVGDLAADFDGDGSLTLFDFLAFQSEFSDGC